MPSLETTKQRTARQTRARAFYTPGPVAVLLVDLLLVNAAFAAAYWVRYVLDIGGEVADVFFLPYSAYLPLQGLLNAILLVSFMLAGVYQTRERRPLSEEIGRVVSSASFAFMAFIAAIFLFFGGGYSRALFLMAWALSVTFLACVRALVRLIVLYRRYRGLGVKRTVVVGSNDLAKTVMHVITTEPGSDYRLIGFVSEDAPIGSLGRFPGLGPITQLREIIQEQAVDEVIVALPAASRERISAIAELCRQEGCGFKIVPDLYELSLSQVDVDQIRGIPLIGLQENTIRGFNLAMKRVMDVTLALVGLVLLAPLWAVIALAIVLDSPGPVFFRQLRVGKNGRLFYVYKFRSMRVGAEEEKERLRHLNEASGPLFKIRNDPRLTRVGRVLRRLSLDELPQLINVLKGEMSLVGPRPPTPEEVAQYEPWQLRRLEVAPGITGAWQVSGRSELPFEEMVLLDLYYIDNWSLALDIQLLLRTIPAVLSGRGAF